MSRDVDVAVEEIAFDQPLPYEFVAMPVPLGFTQQDALIAIAQFVAAQLHAGLSKREITDRLHGYQRTRGEG